MNAGGLDGVRQAARGEIERIWLNEPEDVAALRKGFIPSGAGAYGQYFSVLVMLGSEVRGLAIHAFSNLVTFAGSGRYDLAQLKDMAREMLRVTVGVVGYFGLRRFGRILGDFLEHLDEAASVAELQGLFEDLFTLSNRYQMWLHQTFPWHLSVFFPKRTLDQAEADLQIARERFSTGS
jgi:hypothetical protein